MVQVTCSRAVLGMAAVSVLVGVAQGGLVNRWGFEESASATSVTDSVAGRVGRFEGMAVGHGPDSVAYIDPGAGISGNAVRLKWVGRSLSDLNSGAIEVLVGSGGYGANDDAGRVNLGTGYDGGQGIDTSTSPASVRVNQAITIAGWFKANPLPAWNADPIYEARDWYLWNNGSVYSPGTTAHRAEVRSSLVNLATMSKSGSGPGMGDPDVLPYNPQPGFDLFDGQWHHIAWTQTADDPGTTTRADEVIESIYIDGVLSSDYSSLRQPAVEDNGIVTGYAPQSEWFLGGGSIYNNPANVGLFDGWIDEFRIYDEALGAVEVAQLYNNPAQGFEIPEPASLALIGLGGMALLRRQYPV